LIRIETRDIEDEGNAGVVDREVCRLRAVTQEPAVGAALNDLALCVVTYPFYRDAGLTGTECQTYTGAVDKYII